MRVTARELATKRRHRPRRERDVQRAILDALKLMPGVVAWKTGGGLLPVNGRRVRMGHKGVSDIIAILPPHGQVAAIETKAKGKPLTIEQANFLAGVNAAGGLGFRAESVEDVWAVLNK